MSHTLMGHTILYEWVTSYYRNELSHVYQWFMPCIWMSHVTYIQVSCHIHEWVMSRIYQRTFKDKSVMSHMNTACHDSLIQPIADSVAQHLDIISKNFQFSTRRTRILMGFIIYFLVLIVNPMGRILVRWKSLRNNLEMLCHTICNWL